MKVSNLVPALVVGFLTLGVAHESLGQSAQKKEEETGQSKEARSVYSCPMHPEVTSDKPGKCSKCGMSLVLREEKDKAKHDHEASENSTANEKISQARSLLAEAKKELAEDWKYNCCIKDPCDRCALDHQSCSCAHEVKAGNAVCSDCYAGWQRGEGIVPGIKANQVKGSFHSHKH